MSKLWGSLHFLEIFTQKLASKSTNRSWHNNALTNHKVGCLNAYTGAWFSKKSMTFKEEEYHQLAEAFRHIAMRLNAHTDEIDNASLESPESKNNID